ncbi:MAG: glycosyltransferase family 2 protein [Armatimonadota bacterium]
MDVSVVIVNWNTRDDLRAALKSCREHHGVLDIEVIVVDNGSTDGSAGMVREDFPEVHLIANDNNLGYTKASNHGMRTAQGRYCLMLNSDAELTSGCMSELVRVMDEHDDIGTASAQLYYPDGSKQPTACHFPRLTAHLLPASLTHRIEIIDTPDSAPDSIHDVDWVFGACQMVREETVDDIGLMDERIFMWYDDAEWCRRMADAGWRRVVALSATCIHKTRKSADLVPTLRLNVMMSMSEFEYFRIHEGRIKTAVLWTMRTFYSLCKSVFFGVGSLVTFGQSRRMRNLWSLNWGRLVWHLRHAADIMIHEPKAYPGEDGG